MTSSWRNERNERSLARLRKALPELFPAPVLVHALSRPLIPPTPRRAIESYWSHHPVRADRLARALAARSGAPVDWMWRIGEEAVGRPGSNFRTPPAPYREAASSRGPGHCCVCGQPVFRLGWHRDLWADRKLNRNASWHAACVTAWKLWTAPSDFVRPLKVIQEHRCAESRKRLLRTAEVDHRIPLYRVWREHRAAAWPELLGFWGVPNLRVINREVHKRKTAGENAERRNANPGRPALL